MALIDTPHHYTWRANVRTYVRVTGLLRPHWRQALGAVACVAIATGLSLVIPGLLAWVIDNGVRSRRIGDLALAAGAIILVSLARGYVAYQQGYLTQAVSQHLAYDLRDRVYAHLQGLSFSFLDDAETGQLMSRLTVDVEAIRNFIALGLLRAVMTLLTFGAIAVILFLLDWQLALITLACIPVLAVLSYGVMRRLRALWQDVQQQTGELGAVMQEGLAGIRVVKAFARGDYETLKFDRKNQDVRALSLDAMRTSAWNQPLMIFILNVATVLVLWAGGIAVAGHRLSYGTLFAVVQYVLLFAGPVRTFGFMINWFTRGLSSGHRIFEVLDVAPEITDRPGARRLGRVRGHVQFENVSFAYATGREVLRGIDLAAQPGQIIALLGATGSGKSTVLQLLPRFYDVTGGRVLIDGHDVRDATVASLRQNIGLVLQDIFLFNATLRDNIAYGVATATDEQVVAAATAARLHDFIMALPDGYDAWVGERGVTLSGGQKQRVAIARALLRDPRILVLDDATSSVDMETEYLIQHALDRVMQGRTTFVVASRLRTIKRADEILLIEDGRIVERGTHVTLLARGGAYARLYDLQLREQEEFEHEQQMVLPSARRGAAGADEGAAR